MADISDLEGINSEEVKKLCQANIKTVEAFVAQIETSFNYGVMYMSIKTDIKPDRLIELVPPERVPFNMLPDVWLEGVTNRAVREAEPDDRWLKRCQHGLTRFTRGLQGNWLGWRKNLPMLALVAGLLMLLVLTVRAAGGFHWLPSPLGLRGQALIAAGDMEPGWVLKSDDLYPSLLPLQNDYFKPDDKLEGLILAQRIAGQMPLRFRDVLRLQVVAATDIQADAIIKEEQIKLDWKPYQPGAALTLKEVFGHKANQALRKDGVIISAFVKPAE